MEIRSELVVASDIHLRNPSDNRAKQLIGVIDSLVPGAVRHFVLLGDIFDFCLGTSDYFRNKFSPLGASLEAAAKRGVNVLFFEGNHEFHMSPIGWKGVEFVSEFYRVLTMRDGKRVALTHGDLMHCSWDYRLFRRFVKSEGLGAVARFVPGQFIEAYAFSHASVSRKRDEYRRLDHTRLLDSAEAWVRQASCHYGIFGHFHVPYAEERIAKTLSPSTIKLLSLESWDEPNLLTYDQGKFERLTFSAAGEPIVKPAASLGAELARKRKSPEDSQTQSAPNATASH